MTLRNFGPIRDATLRIAPLTVFIGPGSTGKSYAATAVHSLVGAAGRRRRAGTAVNYGARGSPASGRTLAACKKSVGGGFGAMIEAFNRNGRASMPARVSGAIARHCLTRTLADTLTDEIARNMPPGARGPVRFGCKSIEIGVANGEHASVLRWGETAGVAIRRIPHIAQELVEDGGMDAAELLCLPPRTPAGPIVYRMSNWMANNRLRRNLPQACYVPIPRKIFSGMPEASHYLPAPRSGILSAYRAISSEAIRSMSGAAGAGPRARAMPGTMADLMGALVEMTGDRGEFFGLGREVEKAILRGSVALQERSNALPPEVTFTYRGRSMPPSSASSSVSELAPLILYLKHMVRQSELLVVEEPEAHLHPAAQAALAKFVVRMVRAGLRVLVTTHSETMLEEFSKCLEACRLSGSSRKSALGDPLAYLHQGEIAPHAFAMDGRGWSTAREMPHSEDDGIDEDEFIAVQEALHDEAVRIADMKAYGPGGGRAGPPA